MADKDRSGISRRKFGLTATAGLIGLSGVPSSIASSVTSPVAKGLKGSRRNPLSPKEIDNFRTQFIDEQNFDKDNVPLMHEPVRDSTLVVGYVIGMKNGAPYEFVKELPDDIGSDLAQRKTQEAHQRIDNILDELRPDTGVASAAASGSSDGGAVDWSKSYTLENEAHRDRTVNYSGDASCAPDWCGDIEGDDYLLSVQDSNYSHEWAVDLQVDVWPQVNDGDQQNDYDTECEWVNWETFIETRWDESHFPLRDVIDMAPTREQTTELDTSIQFTASNTLGGGVTLDPESPYIKVDPQNQRDQYVKTHHKYPYDCCKTIARYEHCVLGQDSVATFDSGGSYDSYIVGSDIDHTFQYDEGGDHYDAQTGSLSIGWDIRQT